MARPSLQVEGAARLRRTLKDAGVSVQDLKDAHAQVAELVRERSRPRAPRSAHGSNRGPSGTLANSLRSSGTQSAAVVRAGGARVPYAGPIHFGWAARHIRAQPWITQAAEDAQHTWESMYLTALERIIETVEGTTTP